MRNVLIGFMLGLTMSASAVYVDKLKINNWSERDVKEVIQDYIDGCRVVEHERIEC